VYISFEVKQYLVMTNPVFFQVPPASVSVIDFPDGTWPLEMAAALERRGAFFPSERSTPLVRVVGYTPAPQLQSPDA